MSNFFDNTYYEMWSVWHFVMIATAFILLGITCVLSFRKAKSMTKVLTVWSIMLLLVTVTIITYSLCTGIYNPEWYIPLHLCNLFSVIVPLSAMFKGKVRTFFYDFMCVFGISGCIVAVIFPITTLLYYPPLHIISLLTWLYHVLIGTLGTYLLVCRGYKRFRAFNIISILFVLTIGATIANSYFGTNFLFLNSARTYFPLTFFYNILGKYAVYYIIAFVALSAINLQITLHFLGKLSRKSLVEIFETLSIVKFVHKHNIVERVAESNFVVNLTAMLENSELNETKIKPIVRFFKALLRSETFKKIINTPINEITGVSVKTIKNTYDAIADEVSGTIRLSVIGNVKKLCQNDLITA